jgi:YHS domain-containing protein
LWRVSVLPFLLTLTISIGGCVIQRPSTAADTRPIATCYVCDHNNDLGCVCFRLKDSTPRLTYEGKEYFFCSEDCCQAFRHQPGKYIPKREGN